MKTTFDRHQYWLLVTLLRTLGSRRELTAQFGMHGPALGILAGLGLLMGGLVSLIVFTGRVPASEVLLLCQTLTALVLIPLLVSEAADALLNPAEVTVLAHRPVGNLTYLAAKMTYLAGFSLIIAWAFNLLPSLAGVRLAGTAWFYPATHLLAASAGALFTALATSGVFGVLFRVVPVARVRSLALWTQLLAGITVPLAPHLSRMLHVDVDLNAPWWSALPVTWFAALGLIGQDGGQTLTPVVAVPAMAASIALLALGVRALTQGYMTRVATVVRSRATRARWRWPPLAPRLIRLTGSRAGVGAAAFILRMAMRDWQFRRAAIRGGVPLLMMLLAVSSRGLRSPFSPGAGFSMAHLLPYMIGIAAMTAADFLPFSDHYKARWVLMTVPASGLRGMVRATVGVLWLLGALVPAAALFVGTVAFWGPWQAGLYALYSGALLSFIVGAFAWLQSGLPFTRAPDPTRAAGNVGVMVGVLVLMAILGLAQAWLIFPHPTRIVGAAMVFGTGAWLGAKVSVRILENRVPEHLDAFVRGPGRLFATVSDDGS